VEPETTQSRSESLGMAQKIAQLLLMKAQNWHFEAVLGDFEQFSHPSSR
jgi:hypothetical protein